MRPQRPERMDNKKTGWDIARSRAKAKYARKMKLGKYWKQRWKTDRERMLANLERINKTKKDKADQRTERLSHFISQLPPRINSWDLRPSMAKLYQEMTGKEVSKAKMQATIMFLRRRGLIVFDELTLQWIIKPVA